MKVRQVVLVALAAAVTLTSVAAAGPAARLNPAAQAAPSRIAFVAGVLKPSPSGGYLQTELYVMNADGSGKRRLARSNRFLAPVWSPDGLKLAFQRILGPNIEQCGVPVCNEEIFVVNADGSGQRNLTRIPASDDGFPSWSPDGQTIAFVSGRDGNGGIYGGRYANAEIYLMNADGSDPRNLTRNPAQDSGPAWSPDGRRVAFASGSDGNPGNFNIYVVNADGSGQQNLTRSPGLDGDPAWSPDGRRIAFTSYRDGLTSNRDRLRAGPALYVMNADGSEQRKLTPLSNSDDSFSWSPDGRRIVFVSKRDGNDEVYVINVDGSRLRNLTRNPARDGHPKWSPDGRTIGFVSKRGGNRDIYVMNADGSRLRNLTRGIDQQAFGIAWSPARKEQR